MKLLEMSKYFLATPVIAILLLCTTAYSLNTFTINVKTSGCDSSKTETCSGANATIAMAGIFKIFFTDSSGDIKLPTSVIGSNNDIYMLNKPLKNTDWGVTGDTGLSCGAQYTLKSGPVLLTCEYTCNCDDGMCQSAKWDYSKQKCIKTFKPPN